MNSKLNFDLDFDLTIVGGGIVGLTIACALRNSDLRVAIIEAQERSVAAAKEQAYAITLLSGKIWQEIGVWEQIQPQICTFREIHLSDSDFPVSVRLLPQDAGMENEAGYVAEHRILLQELQNALQDCENITWLCPATVTQVEYKEDRAIATLSVHGEERQISTRLVIAADGDRSPLREAAGIETWGWEYWQSCICTIVKSEKPTPQIAYERFQPSGPFAILPIPGDRFRIVWTAPHAEAEAFLALDDAAFLEALTQRYGPQMGHLQLDGDRFLFRVKLMQGDRYVRHRLVLAGNAAHSCHPVGGQGLNLGIADAGAIAEILQTAWQRGEDIGSLTVLERYERWRWRENLWVLAATDALDRLFSSNLLPLKLLRRAALVAMQRVAPVRSIVLHFMTGLLNRRPQLTRIDAEVRETVAGTNSTEKVRSLSYVQTPKTPGL